MNGPDPRRSGEHEGEARKDAAHRLLEAHREVLIRRGRRALVSCLLRTGTATADDVADAITSKPDVDPRYLGAVPGPLASAGIIRGSGYVKSCRPSRHASILTVWELADRAAALAWLARHPELPDPPEPDDGEAGPPTATPGMVPAPNPTVVRMNFLT